VPGGRPRVARSGKIRRSAGGWTSNALRAGQRQSEQGVTEAVRHHPKEPCRPTWLADVVAAAPRQCLDDIKAQVLELIKARYADLGPTLAAEKLREVHGIPVGRET